MSPDTKSASRSHASLSDHRCTPPHAGQAIGAVIAMWLKSATSHLMPVGTAVSAVGHRTITMYGCFGTAQSLRVRKTAHSATSEIRPASGPSTKPIVATITVGIPMDHPTTTLNICAPFECVVLSAQCCIASTSCVRKHDACVDQATAADVPRKSVGNPRVPHGWKIADAERSCPQPVSRTDGRVQMALDTGGFRSPADEWIDAIGRPS